jgi:hypothetical protein
VQQLAIKLKVQEEEEERQRQAATLAAGAEKAAPKPGSWMENIGRKVVVKPLLTKPLHRRWLSSLSMQPEAYELKHGRTKACHTPN